MKRYQYGQTKDTARTLSIENQILRDRVQCLERALAEAVYRGKVQARRIAYEPHTPYRETLTDEQMNAHPVLRYGDTPEICARRVAESRAEATRRQARQPNRATLLRLERTPQ